MENFNFRFPSLEELNQIAGCIACLIAALAYYKQWIRGRQKGGFKTRDG